MNDHKPPDPMDAAIGATEPAAAAMEQMNISISSTKRQAVFVFPVDMTEAELFEVVGLLGHTLRIELGRRAQVRGATPQLVIAHKLPS